MIFLPFIHAGLVLLYYSSLSRTVSSTVRPPTQTVLLLVNHNRTNRERLSVEILPEVLRSGSPPNDRRMSSTKGTKGLKQSMSRSIGMEKPVLCGARRVDL